MLELEARALATSEFHGEYYSAPPPGIPPITIAKGYPKCPDLGPCSRGPVGEIEAHESQTSAMLSRYERIRQQLGWEGIAAWLKEPIPVYSTHMDVHVAVWPHGVPFGAVTDDGDRCWREVHNGVLQRQLDGLLLADSRRVLLVHQVASMLRPRMRGEFFVADLLPEEVLPEIQLVARRFAPRD